MTQPFLAAVFYAALAALGGIFSADASLAEDWCAYAVGQRPDGSLAFGSASGQPTEYAANLAAGQPVEAQGIPRQSIHVLSAYSGAVAVVTFRNSAGALNYQMGNSGGIDGARGAVAGAVGGLMVRDVNLAFPITGAWIACSGVRPPSVEELSWDPNLTYYYARLRSRIANLKIGAAGGTFELPVGGVVQAPPPQNPVLGDGAGGLAGCWKRYDYQMREDGSVISIVGTGARKYAGSYRVLSPAQQAGGRRPGSLALEIDFAPCCADFAGPNAYGGDIVWDDGSMSPMTFIVSADGFRTWMRSADTKFNWKRTGCP